MREFQRGQRFKLSDLVPDGGTRLELGLSIQSSLTLDAACFGVNAEGKLWRDPYMIFYNQTASPCGGIRLVDGPAGEVARFAFDLERVPDPVERLVLTLAIDGQGTMGDLRAGQLGLFHQGRELARHAFTGADFQQERALLVAELYRKDGVWRCAMLGQGFNGGLSALLGYFGGEEQATPPAAAPAPAPAPTPAPATVKLSKAVRLEKELQHQAPALVSLVKAASVSLEKRGLADHVAKVCLCLDTSGSMSSLYRNGSVQRLAERVLALGCLFDDDKAIDIFLFDDRVNHAGSMSLDNFPGLIDRLIQRHALGGGTAYGRAIKAIREHYMGSAGSRSDPQTRDVPVYVMFVTDGDATDKSFATTQMKQASHEPIFWQFMGVGGGGGLFGFGGGSFPYLERLDDLQGRYVDNADFFAVPDPQSMSDDEIYNKMMNEYPNWLNAARRARLLR